MFYSEIIFTYVLATVMASRRDVIWPGQLTVAEGGVAQIFTRSISLCKWTHNEEPLRIPVNITILDGSPINIVTIDKVQKSDRGIYKCRGKDLQGKTFVAWSALTVLVTDNSRIHPEVFKSEVGTTVIFTCNSTRQVHWNSKDSSLPGNAIVVGHVLSIFKITLSNGGIYFCIGAHDLYLQFTARCELIVYDQKRIHPRSQTVLESDNTYFKCNSHTIPLWLHNDKIIPSNAEPDIEGMIHIQGAKYMNEGYYECLGRTRTGLEFSAKGKLKVLLYVNNKIVPPYQQVYFGQPALITCISNTRAQWSFNNGLLPHNVKLQTDTPVHYLSIASVEWLNVGTYQCEGRDDAMNYSFYAQAMLEVSECQRPKLKHGSVNATQRDLGIIAKYSCQSGFTLHGSALRQCHINGEWSGVMPYCRLSKNNDSNNLKNMSILIVFSILFVWIR